MATNKNGKGEKTFLKVFWWLFAGGLTLVAFVFFLISVGVIGYVPEIEELRNPKNKFATEIYSSDLQILGNFYHDTDNRVSVNYEEISPNMINAVVATEDARFYSHSGIDGKSVLRALIFLGKKGGGSTLTQQLAKQLWSPDADNVFERVLRKPVEWVIAVKLERLYSKEEIITLYLNQYSFNNDAVGIKSAAQIYFNTTPDKLTVEQAAMFAGMLQNSTVYNPAREKFKERTLLRRNVVLNLMEKHDFITQEECDSLKKLPLELNFRRANHREGLAPYFREHLRLMLTAKEPKRSNYADWQEQKYQDDLWQWENNDLYGFCEKFKKTDGSKYNIYTDGLKIYTTIDSRMQRYAEEAVDEHIQYLQTHFFKEKRGRKKAPYANSTKDAVIQQSLERTMRYSERYKKMKTAGASQNAIDKAFNAPTEMRIFSYTGSIDTIMTPLDSIRWEKHFLRTGFMSIDPRSGYVKAYVGGPNYSRFQYDMVSMGRRQVGSTIKPFLYTLAMEEGLAPCDETIHQPITIQTPTGPWSPRNSSTARRGEHVTLRWGLANSSNWVSAYLMTVFTPQSLVDLMRSFGIRGHIDPVVSLCLGPCEVSVEEMVSAYTAFPNNGIRVEPLYVTRIEDVNGNTIATFTPKTQEIFDETVAYKMIYMLRAVVDMGTGAGVRRYISAPMGGKTGTSNDNADGWFIGFTPSLVSGVWVGGEERDIHFDTMAYGQGARMALPIWGIYMKKVLANAALGYSASEQFDIPSSFNPNADCQISSSSGGEEE